MSKNPGMSRILEEHDGDEETEESIVRYNRSQIKAHNHSKLNNSSISKVNTSMQNGFNSSEPRFIPAKPANPGPGQYSLGDNSFVSSFSGNDASFNVKGAGNGFISKTTRFEEILKNRGPGPGAYDSKSFASFSSGKEVFRKEDVSPFFKKHQSVNRYTKNVTMQPGPGDYNTKPLKKNINGLANVFKSKLRRFSNEMNENPSVGEYEFKDTISYSAAIQKNNVSRFFKKDVGPSAKKPKNTLLEEIKSLKIEPDPKESKSAEPGPRSPIIDDLEKNKQSYFFLSKASGNRNGHLYNYEKTPGPGSYLPEIKQIPSKQLVTGAVFKSESDRIEQKLEKVERVGPGLYRNDVQQKKKNFHFNLMSKWV